MAKKTTPPEEPTVRFEEALAQVESAVRQLEEGQLGLSESLECYASAVQHLKHCHRALEAAERQIELLTGVDAEGQPLTEPFAESETSLEAKAANRSRRRSRPSEAAEPSPDQTDMDTPGTLF